MLKRINNNTGETFEKHNIKCYTVGVSNMVHCLLTNHMKLQQTVQKLHVFFN